MRGPSSWFQNEKHEQQIGRRNFRSENPMESRAVEAQARMENLRLMHVDNGGRLNVFHVIDSNLLSSNTLCIPSMKMKFTVET